ncbi:MAG: glycosyltransferase [Bauldia sp.]|nr:glycosyltransferase [Bauldia sp.]
MLVGIVLVGIVGLRLWVAPSLPELGLEEETTSPGETGPLPEAGPSTTTARPDPADIVAAGQRDAASVAADTPWDGNPPAVYVVVPTWSGAALESLKVNLSAVDVVLPQWYQIASADGAIREEDARRKASLAAYLADQPSLSVLPIVGAGDDPDAAAAALSSVAGRQHLVAALAEAASQGAYQGYCLDIWGVAGVSDADILELLAALKRALAPADRQTCLVVPLGDDDVPLEALSDIVDRVVLLGFEEPEPGDRPGPVAPQDWFTGRIATALARLDPQKTVVALGNTGFDWISGRTGPEAIDFPATMHLARRHDAAIRLDPDALNSTVTLVDDAGKRHQIWFLDAVSAYNELVALSTTGVGGVGLWPAGGEDPGFWELVGGRTVPPADVPAALGDVSLDDYVGYEGQGEFLRVVATPEPGVRKLERDPATHLIVAEAYKELPQGYTVHRWGRGAANAIALTFDDGPDPVYTERILDTLKTYHVPAAFFVIGSSALDNPATVKRIFEEGHEIGSHTYWHANLSMTPDLLIRLGLNATQRAIVATTGRKTVLFRAPYGEDVEPMTADEVRPLNVLSDLGYIAVGMQVDPEDWRKPGVDAIVSSVMEQARRREGNVIVMHDAGGDRSETLAALPRIIEGLRAKGFEFVPLGSLIGRTRDELMPVATGPGVVFDRVLAGALVFLRDLLVLLFAIALVLGVARTILIVILVCLRKHHPAGSPDYLPPVTVIVPAFCEEAVIVESIASLLASDYPKLSILVVDDGSTDGTYAEVRRVFATDGRVRIVTQRNQGKAAALNHGYRIVTTPIVVAIDGDTRLAGDAIGLLVRHFQDPKVGAVAGNVKVVNRRGLLAKLQTLEYITSQNLDRRAFETINAITVVPGAIGAWRKEAVLEAGGLASDTLAEDADLTFAVTRAGYRVVYEENAMAMTQAPHTLQQFMIQRFRWVFGMLQTAWKHRGAVLEGRAIGLFGIPNILFFGTALPLLAPLADLFLLFAVFNLVLDAIHHPTSGVNPTWLYATFLYLVYMMSDIVLAIVAFGLEPREHKGILFWTVFQRFYYRQLLYFVVFRAVISAITGRLAVWGKVRRTERRRPVDPSWKAPERRLWERRAIDLKWEGPEHRHSVRRAIDRAPRKPDRK